MRSQVVPFAYKGTIRGWSMSCQRTAESTVGSNKWTVFASSEQAYLVFWRLQRVARRSISWPYIRLFHCIFRNSVALNWRPVFNQSQLYCQCSDVQTKRSSKAVHSKILLTSILIWVVIQDVISSIFLVLHFCEAIVEPSFGVASKLVSILGLKDLAAESVWTLNLGVDHTQLWL